MSFKIYYLDDEPDLCEIMIDRLSSDDVTIETFQDAPSLISRCEKIKPDLIFLDYRLPGMTGDEVAQKLDATIPKILISGDISVQTTYKFISVLQKSISKKDIVSIVSRIMKKD